MQDLYFIAIIPPVAIARELDEIRHQIADKFGSSHALNSPPHITLVPPFKLTENTKHDLHRGLQDGLIKHTPFSLSGEGVGYFQEHTLYAQIELNENLKRLQSDIKNQVQDKLDLKIDRPDREYSPHLTLAFKDLKKKYFKEARLFLRSKEINLSFEVSNIALLQHSGKRWLIDARFEL